MSRTDASPQPHLREALTAFWSEQLRFEDAPQGEGFVTALPLMDASGWQVVLHLRPLTPTQWLVSDEGATLGSLDDVGKNVNARKFREVVEAQCRFYDFERDGLILQKAVAFPFAPTEIQVFAEGLVAISHLAPKVQRKVETSSSTRIEAHVSRYFHQKNWTPERRHKLEGQIESRIVVDFYWENDRALALQPVGPHHRLRDYMERWGWRWTDLGRAHPELIKAMVFDPDTQDWDPDSLDIGRKVCDVFVPYTEADEALDAALTA